MEDRWLSIEEIGEYLGVKRDTVNKWIKDKEMPAHRIGRSWKLDNSLTESAHYCGNRSFGSESKAKAIKRSQSF